MPAPCGINSKERENMMNEPKKVAIYARVSSDKQDVDLSVSAQLRALREYAARNGYSIVRGLWMRQRAAELLPDQHLKR